MHIGVQIEWNGPGFQNRISIFREFAREQKRMDRQVAIRIDGMLIGARGNLDGIAYYMKNNLSDEDYKNLIKAIGESMAALIEISTSLYSEFPDILPKELNPKLSNDPQR